MMFKFNAILNISVDGGWREEPFSECSEVCGSGTKTKMKYCDSPSPAGGELCPCNDNDPNEISCNGFESVIEEQCKEQPCESKSLRNTSQNLFFKWLVFYHIESF